MKNGSDPAIQRRFELGMQLYREAVEVEKMRVRRENPFATEEDFKAHLRQWHLKEGEWDDPAFRPRNLPDEEKL